MGLSFSSFGAIKPHAATHINGGSDEITGELNPLIYGSINVQHVIDARNKIGAVTVSESQDWVNGLGNLLDNASGLLHMYILNNNILFSHDAVVSQPTNVWVKRKTITLNALYKNPSTIRVKFDLRASDGTASGRIYKNDVAVGVQKNTSISTYVTMTQDLEFAEGDTVELWIYHDDTPGTTYAINFRICGTTYPTLADAIAYNDPGVAGVAFSATNS